MISLAIIPIPSTKYSAIVNDTVKFISLFNHFKHITNLNRIYKKITN